MFKKVLSVLLTALMIVSLSACSSGSSFKAGTYTGTSKGFSSDITVEVTLDENKTITDVKVVSSGESADIGEVALPKLVEAVLAQNTSEIDTVSTATVTSNGFIAAVNDALKQAGLTSKDLVANTVTTGDVTEETLEADVVVIGAGGAGMVAAITAADEGKSVIIVEKAPIVGGNTSRATGGMNAAKTSYQDENTFEQGAGVEKTIASAKENYPELADLIATVEKQYADYQANPEGYFDSVELFELDTLVGGKNLNNFDLVKTLAENSADGITWLGTIGADLTSVGSFGGASVKRIHRPVNDEGKTTAVGSYLVPIFEATCEEKGIQVLLETEATEIIMTDGVATGVKATSKTSNYTINTKAVVDAAGGFGGNLDMVVEYKPDLAGFISTNASTITGDGIKMAEAVGANTVDMEQIQIHPTVEQSTANLITEGLRGDGAILVNAEGVRFTDEVGTRDAVSAAEIAQTGGYAWLVVDQKMVDASSVISGYINKGLTVTGSTVEELATAMDVPADALSTTLETWNGAVAAQEDAEFGRTSFAEALDTAPYYAIKIAPGVHHTMGGLEINTNAEVLDTNGEVIPGLFAAGEVTGGVHGANRLGGNAVADIVVFGRIAGSSAASFAK